MILFLSINSTEFSLQFSLSLFQVLVSSLLLLLVELVLSQSLLLSKNDFLNKNLLVLEHVSLREEIQFLVQGGIDFVHGSVFLEESSESSLLSDPHDFLGHSGVLGTSSLSDSHVSSLSLLLESLVGSESGVDLDILLSDESAGDHRSNVGS